METLHGMPLFRRGKVRDTWQAGDDLLMVASDRISAFDVNLPATIPDKGVILTQLSCFWFDRLADIVPNHLITTDLMTAGDGVPQSARQDPALAGRSMLVRRAERIDVECVVRGYLYGSVWSEYQQTGMVAGRRLPAGLRFAEQLDEPLFSPALKVDDGHDVNVSPAEVADQFGQHVAEELTRLSLAIYRRAHDHVAQAGLPLADTKFEFGWIDGRIALIDEVLTPDSSRYWEAASYAPGREQQSFDKQPLRDWLMASGWDKQPPGPPLPRNIVRETRDRYLTAFERITGRSLPDIMATEAPFAAAVPAQAEQGGK